MEEGGDGGREGGKEGKEGRGEEGGERKGGEWEDIQPIGHYVKTCHF